MSEKILRTIDQPCDPTLYRYLVSHTRDRKEMIVRRIYQRGDLILECEKEFVDLTKTPDANESEAWKCVFRKNRMRMNVEMPYEKMVHTFRAFWNPENAKAKYDPALIDDIRRMSDEGASRQEICKKHSLAVSSFMTIMRHLSQYDLK
jgi:hypothetical protein